MRVEELPSWQGNMIVEEGVYARLEEAANGAVVLDRWAMGGGATDWYVCLNGHQLLRVARRLRPGSCVSFYFDDRVQRVQWDANVRQRALQILRDDGEVLLGQRAEGDEIALDMCVVSGPLELDEEAPSPGIEVYMGAFPGRDNDGLAAITFILPDRDGVVRAHPH